MSLSPPIYNLARSFDEADDTSASGTSPAQLNLQRLFEQSISGASASKKDAQKPAAPGPNSVGAAPKGKPRLLLMGQRRYDIRGRKEQTSANSMPQERKVIHLECSLPQAAPERDSVP